MRVRDYRTYYRAIELGYSHVMHVPRDRATWRNGATVKNAQTRILNYFPIFPLTRLRCAVINVRILLRAGFAPIFDISDASTGSEMSSALI